MRWMGGIGWMERAWVGSHGFEVRGEGKRGGLEWIVSSRETKERKGTKGNETSLADVCVRLARAFIRSARAGERWGV